MFSHHQRQLTIARWQATLSTTCLTDVFDGVGHFLVLSEVFGQSLPGLLQDRRRADVDFRDHHGDRDLVGIRRSAVGAVAQTAVGKASIQAPGNVHEHPQNETLRTATVSAVR